MNTHDGMMDDNYSNHFALADLHFNRAIGKSPEMESSKAMANFVSDYLQIDDKIADIGCSAGHYLRSIRRKSGTANFQYVGIEFHDLLLNKARQAWGGGHARRISPRKYI